MRETLAFVFPCLLLYAYMVLSSVEFGASVFNMWPQLLSRRDALKTYLSPIWEVTNVFLVTFITCMFSFFPRANAAFGTNLLMVIFPGLVFFGLRVLGMLLIYYGGVRSFAVNVLYLAGSFLAPITWSLAFVFMLTGSWQLWSPVFLGLAITVATTIVLVSSAFFRWFGRESFGGALDTLVRWSTAILLPSYALLLVAVSPMAPHLFPASAAWRPVVLVAIVAYNTIALWNGERTHNALASVVATASLVAALFLLPLTFHLPYVIYPSFTVFNAITNPAALHFMAAASLIGVVFLIPALALLFRLFVTAPSSGDVQK